MGMKLKKVLDRKVWDRIAKEYQNKKYYGKHLFKKEREILLSLIRRGSSLLDVACGTGRHVRFFKTHKINAIGLDASKEMIRYAKSISNDRYIIGDAHSLPFKDHSFDYVTCLGNSIGSLMAEKAIKEMLRVARIKVIVEFRHGGKIEKRLVGNHSYFVKTWTEEEVGLLLKNFKVKYEIIKGQELTTTYFFYAVMDGKP